MGITIKDIAKVAGVSYSTVSKALRDSPLVKPPTKKRIVEIADQLGYQPNVAARSLVSKKSNTIGIVWPTIERAAHAALITKINKELELRGYTSLISINNITDAIHTFQSVQVDAILIFNDQKNTESARSNSVPILSYGISDQTTFPTIDVNRKEAIRMAVGQLSKAGHRDITFIGDLSDVDPLQEEKAEGFKEGMMEYLGSVSRASLIDSPGMALYDGYIGAKHCLESASPPTAIISGSFDLTRGIIRAVKEANLTSPDDITIISYDNIPQTSTFDMPISIVGVPIDEITNVIIESLINIVDKGEVPTSVMMTPVMNEVRPTSPLS